MRLMIDLDGCLAEFNKAYVELLIRTSGKNLFPKDWETNPNFPPTWFYDSHYGYTPFDIQRAWREIDNSSTFWYNLEPLNGALSTITKLDRIASTGDQVYFITQRTGYRCKEQTERWLSSLGMLFPTVIVTGQKLPIIEALGIHAVIDDRLPTVNELAAIAEEEGTLKCKGKIYLKDAPYNREGRHPDLKVVGSVKEMLEDLGLWR